MAGDSGRGRAIRIEPGVAGSHQPHPAIGGAVCHAAAEADRGSGNAGGAGGWTPEKNGGGVELNSENIPSGWEVKPLGALVSYTNGKAHEDNITDSGKYVVVNSKFISTEGLTRKFSDHCFCPTSKNDVLMVMSDVPNGRAIARCYWVEI